MFIASNPVSFFNVHVLSFSWVVVCVCLWHIKKNTLKKSLPFACKFSVYIILYLRRKYTIANIKRSVYFCLLAGFGGMCTLLYFTTIAAWEDLNLWETSRFCLLYKSTNYVYYKDTSFCFPITTLIILYAHKILTLIHTTFVHAKYSINICFVVAVDIHALYKQKVKKSITTAHGSSAGYCLIPKETAVVVNVKQKSMLHRNADVFGKPCSQKQHIAVGFPLYFV